MWDTAGALPSFGNRVGMVNVSKYVAMPRWAVGVLTWCLVGAACGEADVRESAPSAGMVAADGEPDCGGDEPWIIEYDIDLDEPGERTGGAVLRPYLEQWQDLFAGDIVMIGEDTAAWRLEGAELVVAYATRTNPGGLAVTRAAGCDPYGPEVLPGPPSPGDPYPHTLPPVSAVPTTAIPTPESTPRSASATTPMTTQSAPHVPRLTSPFVLEQDVLDEPAPRLDPPPPDLAPAMSVDEVEERFRPQLEASSDRPASRVVIRFALYTGIDQTIQDSKTQPPTVENLPVWIVVADGLLIIPNCPATSIPSDTQHCAPIRGYGMIIAADNDGHEIMATWRNGTAPNL
jgi:hypothetical protein